MLRFWRRVRDFTGLSEAFLFLEWPPLRRSSPVFFGKGCRHTGNSNKKPGSDDDDHEHHHGFHDCHHEFIVIAVVVIETMKNQD